MYDVNDNSEIAMTLIAYSGESRTFAFQALEAAKKQDFEKAKEYIEKSEMSSLKAHKAQTELLVKEANGDTVSVNVLLVHSQDHLMTSMLALELIKEIIELHEVKENRKEEESF
jgi:Phosphotransferase system cellobiose-specific component IIA